VVAVWGSDAPSSKLHLRPRGIAVAGSGTVYVLSGPEPGKGKAPAVSDPIVALSPAGRYVTSWTVNNAEAIAVGGSGNVFVLSTEQLSGQQQAAGRIDEFSPSDARLSTWYTPGLTSAESHRARLLPTSN
jgi:hypothetical protein